LFNRKRIALITTWYPPISSVATLRMDAFTKYLSEDFDVVVYTLGDTISLAGLNDFIQVNRFPSHILLSKLKSNTNDSKLAHQIKTALRIIAGKIIRKPLKQWVNKAFDKLVTDHAERPFDCIISSFAPQEAHEVAIQFKKAFPNIPWIADMRDEMSGNAHATTHAREKFAAFEKQLEQHANAITTVSLPIVNSFESKCPKVPRIIEIQNGYNHHIPPVTIEKGDTLRLGYFGTFYGSRKPTTLFQAWENALQKHEHLPIELHLVGAHANFSIPEKLRPYVHLHSGLPYEKAIAKMQTMHANVLIHPRTEMKGVYTGKLYDYLSVCRPVLGLIDKDDVAAQLIHSLHGGYVAEFSSVEEIENEILQLIEDWKSNNLRIPNHAQVQLLHRKEGVKQLKHLILELCEI
jgi:hypothetical protein